MIDELQINEQVPTQEDPPKKKLYKGLVKEKLYTKSYEDFENQFSTPESIGKLYKGLSDEGLYTKTDKDFQQQYFSDLKKKELRGSVDLEKSSLTYSPTQSQLPSEGELPTIEIDRAEIPFKNEYEKTAYGIDNPIDLVKYAEELKTKTKVLPTSGMGAVAGGGNEVADEEAISSSKSIKAALQQQGIDPDKLNEQVKDVH